MRLRMRVLLASLLLSAFLGGMTVASAWKARPAAPASSEPPQKPLSYYGQTSAGIPGAHNADHFGVVVSNLDDALKFCTTVLGADLLWTAGPFHDPVNNPSRYEVDGRAVSRVA